MYPQENQNDSTLYFTVKDITANKATYTEHRQTKSEDVAIENLSDADCDFNPSYQYLVCANFSKKEDAEKFKNILLSEGYSHADMIFYKKLYRVYAMQIFEYENELHYLQVLRKKYRGAYLLNVE